ncbi:MAG: DUF305 domain-containing protein [Brevinema sp.]
MKSQILGLLLIVAVACAKQKTTETGHGSDHGSKSGAHIIALMHDHMSATEFIQTDNLDLNFIRNMTPHHEGAIRASKELLTQTQNKELITLASNIINSQEKELEEFKTLSTELKNDAVTYTEEQISNYNMLAMSNVKMMMDQMMLVPQESTEEAFLQGMIQHHMSAVADAKLILSVTSNTKIKQIANKILAEQESEITLMKNLISSIQTLK